MITRVIALALAAGLVAVPDRPFGNQPNGAPLSGAASGDMNMAGFKLKLNGAAATHGYLGYVSGDTAVELNAGTGEYARICAGDGSCFSAQPFADFVLRGSSTGKAFLTVYDNTTTLHLIGTKTADNGAAIELANDSFLTQNSASSGNQALAVGWYSDNQSGSASMTGLAISRKSVSAGSGADLCLDIGTNSAAYSSGANYYATHTSTMAVKCSGAVLVGPATTSGVEFSNSSGNLHLVLGDESAYASMTANQYFANNGFVLGTTADTSHTLLFGSGTLFEVLRGDGSVGASITTLPVTSGGSGLTKNGYLNYGVSRLDVTHANIVACGASTTCDQTLGTYPANSWVKAAVCIVDGQEGTLATITASLGKTSTAYTDYILPGSVKAAAATVYGDDKAGSETGASLFDATSKWIPDYEAASFTVKSHIIGSANLSTSTVAAYHCWIDVEPLP